MNEYEQDMEVSWQRLQEPLRRADTTHIPAGVLHLARVVAGVPDPEMTCEACQAWLPSYVDDEIGALPVQTLYPKVKRHLELCDECVVEYLEMRDWALLVDEGRLPQVVESAIPDLSFLPPLSLTEYVRSVAKALVQALAPEESAELPSVADMLFDFIVFEGPGFRFQPDASLGDNGLDALQIVTVTYNSTQRVLQEWSESDREPIETQIKRGILQQALRKQAEQEARQHLQQEEAQRFAEQYAQVVSQTPAALLRLLESKI